MCRVIECAVSKTKKRKKKEIERKGAVKVLRNVEVEEKKIRKKRINKRRRRQKDFS